MILVKHLSSDVTACKNKNINFPMFKKQIISVLRVFSKKKNFFFNTMFQIYTVVFHTTCLIKLSINCSFSVL